MILDHEAAKTGCSESNKCRAVIRMILIQMPVVIVSLSNRTLQQWDAQLRYGMVWGSSAIFDLIWFSCGGGYNLMFLMFDG